MIIFGDKIFNNCSQEIIAFSGKEVYSALKTIEKIKKTKYVIGYIRYEARKAFSGDHIKSNKPLLYFKVYDKFSEYNPSPAETKGYINTKPLITFEEYDNVIKKIKKQIEKGNTYQVNYTIDTEIITDMTAYEMFQTLLATQNTPYAAFIENNYESILSFSPELFFEIKNNKITTRPMKGTIRTGETNGVSNKSILQNDSKNRAENLMIVDLLRNDIGKICKIGTVKVPKLFEIEDYSTLHQMTSTIEGELLDKIELHKVFEALFPCGSITGAPKIETMKIIHEIEKGDREVYCGAIGYFSPKETIFSVPIRILQSTNTENSWKYRVGGGIVWDSEAKSEWDECILKSAFLTKSNPSDFKIIETMLCKDKKVLLEKEHFERMSATAQYFGFKFNPDIDLNRENDCIIRLLLSKDGNINVEYKEIEKIKTTKIKISDKKLDSKNPFLKYKTTYRPWYNEALEAIKTGEIFDVLFLNEKNELCEGARSNVFIEIDNILYTPPIESGLLNGVFRQNLINNQKCLVKSISLQDLEHASAVYCGNSVRELVKVSLF